METLVLKVTFNLKSGDEKIISFSALDPAKSDQELKTALTAMVTSGALGVGADAATSVQSAQKVSTTTTDVSLA